MLADYSGGTSVGGSTTRARGTTTQTIRTPSGQILVVQQPVTSTQTINADDNELDGPVWVLTHLTGQNFGYDMPAWAAWWKEHRDSYGVPDSSIDP